VFLVRGDSDESFEDLLGWEADFAGDGDSGEVVGIDFVGAELVGNFELVEKTGGVGLVCGHAVC